jgi:hypothetical protein
MEKSSQIAWKVVPLRHFFPLKVVPLIEVFLYILPSSQVRFSTEVVDNVRTRLRKNTRQPENTTYTHYSEQIQFSQRTNPPMMNPAASALGP